MDAALDGLIDGPRLTAWLGAHVPEAGNGPLQVQLLHGGYSNVVVALDRGGQKMVLRRPPQTPPPGATDAMLREARILTALNGTRVPHPHCFGSCDDTSVIGSVFYVMERVEGWAGEIAGGKIRNTPPFDRMPYDYGIPFAVADALIALANVDYEAVGLSDYGKPENYLERQVDRWARQLSSYKEKYDYEGRELPGYAETERWLRDNIPNDGRPGIMHGDISTSNMMFAASPPAKVVALLDWELSTIGDPLVDLAIITGGMRDERMPELTASSVHDSTNWPTRQELARYYAAGTGRSVEHLDYYLILTRFKGGCIMEYKVAQAAIGKLDKKIGEFFGPIVLNSFASAADHIRRIS